MKLTQNELRLIVAGVKTLYSSVKSDSGEARYYADIYARLTEQEELDAQALEFVKKFTDKVLERTQNMIQSGVNTEEARLRASIVSEIYVGIKEKVNAKQSKQ